MVIRDSDLALLQLNTTKQLATGTESPISDSSMMKSKLYSIYRKYVCLAEFGTMWQGMVCGCCRCQIVILKPQVQLKSQQSAPAKQTLPAYKPEIQWLP